MSNGKTIGLDPGHYTGINKGVLFYEGNNNWNFALVLKKKLEQAGYKVILSKSSMGEDKPLKTRATISSKCDMFFSIHSDALPGKPHVRGVTVYDDINPKYANTKLGRMLSSRIAKVLNTVDKGVLYRESSSSSEYIVHRSPQAKKSNYYGVVRNAWAKDANMLIEHGYHTNLEDSKAFLNKHDEVADVYVKTLNEYYGFDSVSKPKKYADKTGDKFIPTIKDLAIDGWHTHKILPSLTIAQAILESDWGRSELAQNAYAIFGIKAHTDPSWTDTYTKSTKEWSNGKYITVNAGFKAYDSWKESIQDRCTYLTDRTINGKKIYADVIGEADYKEACKKIWEAGYATDPNYPNKLINIIEKYNLQEYDEQAFTENTLSGIEDKKMEYAICYWNDGDLANAQALLNVLGGKAFLTKTKNATDLPARTIIQVGGAKIEGADIVLAGENREMTLKEITEWVEKTF